MNTKNSYLNNFSEITRPASDFHRGLIPAAADTTGLRSDAAKRLGVCVVLAAFIACYLYGIKAFGVMLGVGLGWLPSAFIAWLVASVIGFAIHRTRQEV